MKKIGLAELIDNWVDDYGADAFIEDYMDGWTFGEIVEFMYEVGEISSRVVENFLED